MDSDLIAFLGKADSYPHDPGSVEHIQTHISHVFIAPPYVYKFKKSVDFGFLDYSTLEKRKEFCRREVELNRRLCEGVYLGVISIIRSGQEYAFAEEKPASGEIVEYAVEMEQLEERYFLHRLIEDGKLTEGLLDRVTDKLASFYLSQDPKPEISKWGKVDRVKVNTDENFEQTESFVGDTLERNTFEAIRKYTNGFLERNAALFEKRVAENRIVDGHGDLHLDHIHISPGQVRIYDCIEFNDRFRYGDLAADLAFLAMDLDFINRWEAERYFTGRMSEELEDPDLPDIIDFYKCYRAYVKGKVKSLQSTEEEVPKQDRESSAELARRYFRLSLRYALIGSDPVALVFMGGVGTGKSTLARHVENTLGIHRFSSDRIRKRLAGLPLEKRPPASKRKELYSAEMSDKTYDTLADSAIERLKEGESVVLDATFSSPAGRKKIIERFRTHDFRYLFIEASAPEAIVRKRLEERDRLDGIVSDARLEDYEKLHERYRPPEEIPDAYLIEANTDCRKEQTISRLYAQLVEKNLRQ